MEPVLTLHDFLLHLISTRILNLSSFYKLKSRTLIPELQNAFPSIYRNPTTELYSNPVIFKGHLENSNLEKTILELLLTYLDPEKTKYQGHKFLKTVFIGLLSNLNIQRIAS